jgi:uncharacterized membrane protein
MSFWSTLLRAGRELTVLTERVDRLRSELDARSGELTDVRERVVRIETLIDLAARYDSNFRGASHRNIEDKS